MDQELETRARQARGHRQMLLQQAAGGRHSRHLDSVTSYKKSDSAS